MLPQTHIHPELAPASPLAFGAASVGGRASPRAALGALRAALEGGVTVIDLARSYGYGEAESLIGKAIGQHRERVILCTKAGIAPSAPASPLFSLAKDLARPFAGPLGALRKALPGRAVGAAKPQPFDLNMFRASLDASLAALGTDRVDIFLAHVCPPSPAAYDDFAALCLALADAGKIILWGISGRASAVAAVSGHAPPPVTQTPAADGDAGVVATHLKMLFQPFGGREGVERLEAAAPRDLTRAERARWVAEIALCGPLSHPSETPRTVICAMNALPHVAMNLDAVAHPRLSPSSLDAGIARVRRSQS